jgi:hypothetical protein
MCYGNVNVFPKNFIPQIPQPDTVTPCNGLGMGFNLWRMKMFTDGKLEKPYFKTVQEYTPGIGGKAYTQDLYHFEMAAKYGYRFGCDSRVRVGHHDSNTGVTW